MHVIKKNIITNFNNRFYYEISLLILEIFITSRFGYDKFEVLIYNSKMKTVAVIIWLISNIYRIQNMTKIL